MAPSAVESAAADQRVTLAHGALQSSATPSGHNESASQRELDYKAVLESRDDIRRKMADAAALRMGAAQACSAASEPGDRWRGKVGPPSPHGAKCIDAGMGGASEYVQGAGSGTIASRAFEPEVIDLIESD